MSSESGAAPDIAPGPTTKVVWIGAPIAAAAAFYLWNFADLFPLIEYRQWIDGSDLGAALDYFYKVAIVHDGPPFSRGTSFLGVALFSAVCGTRIACHNLLNIGLLLGAAALLGLALMRQSRDRHPAIVAATLTFFLFSIPVIDAAAWQATALDKFAVLLTALFMWYVSRPQKAPLLIDQLALLALTVMTINAKEAAWAALPAAVLLATVQGLEEAPWSARTLAAVSGRVMARFALSLCYFGLHVGLVLAWLFFDAVGDLTRVTSGAAWTNLQIYGAYLFGAAGVGAAAVMALLIATCLAQRRTRLMLLWALISFAVAIAIPLKTSGQPPFYLLVPLLFLSTALFWTASAIMETWRNRIARTVLTAALSGALAMRLVGFIDQAGPQLALAGWSRNFQAVLAAIRVEIARSRPAALTFDAPATQPRAYMFLGSTGAPSGSGLASFIAPPGASASEIDALRRAIDAPAKGESLHVRLRPDMSLEILSRLP